MRVVALQPSYIPWRGFFHQIYKADLFVFYDCVQYDKHGWRNRNQIKTRSGLQWLTVPVHSKGCVGGGGRICDIRIDWSVRWSEKHMRAIQTTYGKAPFFQLYMPVLEAMYGRRDELLADFTCTSTQLLAECLGIRSTKFLRSSSLALSGEKTVRLHQLLLAAKATHYITGPSAMAYLDEELLRQSGVSVEYMKYDYPEYSQLHGAFEGKVSVLDLLFNMGPEAATMIW